jgi:hypothetical protein
MVNARGAAELDDCQRLVDAAGNDAALKDALEHIREQSERYALGGSAADSSATGFRADHRAGLASLPLRHLLLAALEHPVLQLSCKHSAQSTSRPGHRTSPRTGDHQLLRVSPTGVRQRSCRWTIPFLVRTASERFRATNRKHATGRCWPSMSKHRLAGASATVLRCQARRRRPGSRRGDRNARSARAGRLVALRVPVRLPKGKRPGSEVASVPARACRCITSSSFAARRRQGANSNASAPPRTRAPLIALTRRSERTTTSSHASRRPEPVRAPVGILNPASAPAENRIEFRDLAARMAGSDESGTDAGPPVALRGHHARL